MFFVYVDWTLEQTPRPFYVGKGLLDRVGYMKRNNRHTNVSNKHGVRREIVIEIKTNDEACFIERQLIALHRTFVYSTDYNGIGCNFTKGGDGNHGFKHRDESKAKMSVAKSGKLTGKRSIEFRKIVSKRTSEAMHRTDVRERHLAGTRSLESREKRSKALKGKNRPRSVVEKMRKNRNAFIASHPEFRLNQSKRMTERYKDPAQRAAMSAMMKAACKRPEVIEKRTRTRAIRNFLKRWQVIWERYNSIS